ncbi:dTMP kinase [Synechococcus sp. PCC 7336]|uniref:dTMP kinase n=1 Tax=Synechococcus sp. PCC 7336 TaxID=195250 RepID=UPI0003474186|nr:dTMP kinase [Synechococcus sp. PCC 7336]
MPTGYFITLEGGEGAGKTTLLTHLARKLETLGHPTLTTREPGGTPLGNILRQLLLESDRLAPTTELLLYAADRAEHVSQTIQPALNGGKIVLCDRYTDSTVAYQGYGRQLDLDLIQQLNQIATCGLAPHLTFWLDLPVETGLKRAGDRAKNMGQSLDRLEQTPLDFHHRLHHGFRQLAEQNGDRIARLDATQPPDCLATAAWVLLTTRWPELAQTAQSRSTPAQP